MTLNELDASIAKRFVVSEGPHNDSGEPYVSFVYDGLSELQIIDAFWHDLSSSNASKLQWRERPSIDGGMLRARAWISS